MSKDQIKANMKARRTKQNAGQRATRSKGRKAKFKECRVRQSKVQRRAESKSLQRVKSAE